MKNAPRTSLGDRLRRERERRHWTQKYLSDQIGVAVPSLIRWEKGQFKPSKYALQKLVDLFGPVETWGGDRARVWTVPYFRNLYFTGRERILTRLSTLLSEHQMVAMSQVRAISGLGGIGKTQTAVEYAYRYAGEYDMVLWLRADSREALVAQFAGLASHFGLPSQADADQHRLAKVVKHWLEQQQQVWLLIFDNVEDIQVVKEFLPTRGKGAALLTTRLHAVGKHIHKIELDKLSLEEGVLFLHARTDAAREQGPATLPEAERQAAEQLCMLMDGLPLALDQAAAYIEEHRCSLAEYLVLYQQQRATFLHLRNKVDAEDYPDSVATTWLLSFQRIEEKHPAAAELLRLCAFLSPDAIPEEILTEGAASLGQILAPVAGNVSQLNQAIEALRAYSLVRRNPGEKTLSIHRLVQAVLQDKMEAAERRCWAERALLAVNAAFPSAEPETWPQCERLLTQALFVTQSIGQDQAIGEEAGRLFYETASYLHYRAHNTEAEPLYQRALYIQKQWLGPEHPDVAKSLNNLGALYYGQGKYAEAELLCQRALRIWEQQLGPEHPDVATSLNNLAIFYSEQGKYGLAEPLYQRALAICEQQLGASHHDTARGLNNLANLYRDQGKYTEAEPLYQRALDIWEQQLGLENSRVAYPLDGLAGLYRQQGKYAEAEPLYQRAVHIREQQRGSEHPETAETMYDLAQLREAQGNREEARMWYARALAARELTLGTQHPQIREAHQGFIEPLQAIEGHEEAAQVEAAPLLDHN